jgi:LL-diaminopimelate aminotransferase
MPHRKSYFELLEPNYLFPQVKARAEAFAKSKPEVKLASFGIGDVSLPLVSSISKALEKASYEMSLSSGFKGYGPEQGYLWLREKISDEIYQNKISPDEIFISDGAKCDIARILTWLPPKTTFALQTPCYPAFNDAIHLIAGKQIQYLDCELLTACPIDIESISADVLVLVNPNNPSGHLLDKQVLQSLINQSFKNNFIILYDSAYQAFIRDENYPKSIYELEGAEEKVIEISSFSKRAGFTGLRLGWSVISKKLRYKGCENSPVDDFRRLIQTLFNGASYLSQVAGLAALSEEGLKETTIQLNTYLHRAQILAKGLKQAGMQVSGGMHSPFVWAKPLQSQLSSWQLFDYFLHELGWICTPGSGFGKKAEGFVRFSGFASQDSVDQALSQLSSFDTFNFPKEF